PLPTSDVLDLLLVRDLPGEHISGVAADSVKEDENEQDDAEHRRDHLPPAPDDVCGHCPPPPASCAFRGRPSLGGGRDVNILPLRVQDGVLLVALYPRLRRHVAVAADV